MELSLILLLIDDRLDELIVIRIAGESDGGRWHGKLARKGSSAFDMHPQMHYDAYQIGTVPSTGDFNDNHANSSVNDPIGRPSCVCDPGQRAGTARQTPGRQAAH